MTDQQKLITALQQIADCEGMTLLGCSPDNEYNVTSSKDEERAHEYGANKAFEQCANIAKAALDQS